MITRIVVGFVGVVLLAVGTVSFFTAQLWGVLRLFVRKESADATSVQLAERRTLMGEIMGSGVLLMSGAIGTGCALVAAAVVDGLWAIAIMAAVGLARWAAVSAGAIRHATMLRKIAEPNRPVRLSRLTRHKMTTIAFGATLCFVIANEARFKTGWSQDWRITTAAGIGTATFVTFLFEIPRNPSRVRKRAVLIGTLAGGPVILLLAGSLNLTPWEQGIVTELGVGLSLVGIIDVLIRDSDKYGTFTDKGENAVAKESIEEAATDLFSAEAFVFRNNVDESRVHDPALHDIHLSRMKEVVTLARSDKEVSIMAARIARRKERSVQVRSRIDELFSETAKEYSIDTEPWNTRFRNLAEVVANDSAVALEEAEVELRAAARIVMAKKIASQMRHRELFKALDDEMVTYGASGWIT